MDENNRIYTIKAFSLHYNNIVTIIMAIHKKEAFSKADQQLAIYAKALAHPARVAILKLLIKKQACICGAIVDELPLSQSTVSQHLKELKDAGLIKGDIDGAKVCYCIDNDAWKTAQTLLGDLFISFKNVTCNCC